jgi:hypothetical protein
VGRLILGIPFPQLTDDEEIHSRRDAILPKTGRYYDIPQALFDLATMICTKSPQCQICPMRKGCKAAPKFLSGTVEIPKQMVKKAKEKIHQNKPYPDRIYRGRILKIVREHPTGITRAKIGSLIDTTYNQKKDRLWVEAMLDRLMKEQFIKQQGTKIVLF